MKPTLGGVELTPEALEQIKAQIEGFDTIEDGSAEMRELIASEWPELLSKLPPYNKR